MTTTTALEVREVTVPSALALELEMSAGTASPQISAAMGKAFSTLMAVVRTNSLAVAGAPRSVYRSWTDHDTQCSAMIPIVNAPAQALGEGVKVVSIPEEQALRFTHHGSYQTMRETYAEIDAWLRARGAIETGADWAKYAPMWEEYIGDPTTTPEQELMTYIYLPLE